jgi:two-component system, NarL family, sensor histidine kinase UhpB
MAGMHSRHVLSIGTEARDGESEKSRESGPLVKRTGLVCGCARLSAPGPTIAAMSPGTLSTSAAGASLRFRVNAIVAALMSLFVVALLVLQMQATRHGVQEEIVGANRVAGQLLERVGWIYSTSGPVGIRGFLSQLGRVRANDITLIDDQGEVLYRSPPSAYKQGRAAPAWFTGLVQPPVQGREIRLAGGRLSVQADPSRAILDGWDDLVALSAAAAVALVAINGLVFWLVGRALQPFPAIVQGLQRLQQGEYGARLPALPGREAASIGAAVNQMAAAIEEHVQARLRAFETERRLQESRDLVRQIEHHRETERRELARELHDELGQSVTAIRSLAKSLQQRLPASDGPGHEAATLIAAEAARLYDGMHGLIPRLTPMALESLGLADALAELVGGIRQRQPELALSLSAPALQACPQAGLAGRPPRGYEQSGGATFAGEDIDPAVALATYRVVQEALNNALKHSGARRIDIAVSAEPPGPQGARLVVSVCDDGCGLPEGWQGAGRYGLLGLRERVSALGGECSAQRRPEGGTCVQAVLPLGDSWGGRGE